MLFRSRSAVLDDSSWAIGPLESILESASSPLWRLRISPSGEILLITRISDWIRLICSSIFLIAIIWLDCDSEFSLDLPAAEYYGLTVTVIENVCGFLAIVLYTP